MSSEETFGEALVVVEWSAPSTIGAIQLEKMLARGAMGEVWLGYDPVLERKVAIKFLMVENTAGLNARELFLAEARTVAKLSHPRIVGIHDVGEYEGRLFIVLPYVAGENLNDKLLREGKLDAAEAVKVVGQVVDALEYAGRHQVVHGDIKPANLLLDENGDVHVADFGLSGLFSVNRESASVVMGTPNYMAPEQAAGAEADFRADIYSLGILLFRMVVGSCPYEAKDPNEVLRKVYSLNFPEPPELVMVAQGKLVSLIRKMVAVNAQERMASYPQLKSQLARLYRELSDNTLNLISDDGHAEGSGSSLINRSFESAINRNDGSPGRGGKRELSPGKKRLRLVLQVSGALVTVLGISFLVDGIFSKSEPADRDLADAPGTPAGGKGAAVESTAPGSKPSTGQDKPQVMGAGESMPVAAVPAGASSQAVASPGSSQGQGFQGGIPLTQALVPAAPSGQVVTPVAVATGMGAGGNMPQIAAGQGSPATSPAPARSDASPVSGQEMQPVASLGALVSPGAATAMPPPLRAAERWKKPATAPAKAKELTSQEQVGRQLSPGEGKVLVDDQDSEAVKLDPPAKWMTSANAAISYNGSSRITGAGAPLRSATFSATVPEAGKYTIWYYLGQTEKKYRFTDVPVTIHASSGDKETTMSQVVRGSGYVSLGVYELAQGKRDVLTVSTKGLDPSTGGFLVADSIILERAR